MAPARGETVREKVPEDSMRTGNFKKNPENQKIRLRGGILVPAFV